MAGEGAAAAAGRFGLRNPGLFRGFGPVGLGLTAGEFIGDGRGGARDYAANIARGAGIGATILSPFFGGLGMAAGGLIGGGLGAAWEYFDDDTPKVAQGTIPFPTATPSMTAEEAAALYDKYFGGGGGGGVSAATGLNRQEEQILRDYWNSVTQYGQNRAQALGDMFSGVSAARARAGQSTERGGTNLAADIENLYSRLGAQASQPMAATGSPTAGLAPVSGEMATAAQTIPSEGANLANYLAAATGAEARNIYDIAAAQALQGAGMTQGFMDTLYMAEQAAIADQRNRAAARIAQAQAAAAAAADRRNQFLLEFELDQRLENRLTEKQRNDALLSLAFLQTQNPDVYENLQEMAGAFQGNPSLQDIVTARPDILNLFLENR